VVNPPYSDDMSVEPEPKTRHFAIDGVLFSLTVDRRDQGTSIDVVAEELRPDQPQAQISWNEQLHSTER
jgi:hypothetical protein